MPYEDIFKTGELFPPPELVYSEYAALVTAYELPSSLLSIFLSIFMHSNLVLWGIVAWNLNVLCSLYLLSSFT